MRVASGVRQLAAAWDSHMECGSSLPRSPALVAEQEQELTHAALKRRTPGVLPVVLRVGFW